MVDLTGRSVQYVWGPLPGTIMILTEIVHGEGLGAELTIREDGDNCHWSRKS